MSRVPDEKESAVRAVAETLSRRAGGAGDDPARAWVEAGFGDPEEVAAWLDAGCLEAAHARRLDDAGITPEQAALRTTAGSSDTEDTLARKFTRGELSLEEARRLITREFWNE